MKLKRKGYAYVTVLMIFLVLMIFVATTMTIFNNNNMQSKHQERSIQAYYLARSGVDLGVAALMKQGPGGANDTLLFDQYSSSSKPNQILNQSINLSNGKVDITIHSFVRNSKRWVEVHSIGTLAKSSVIKAVNLQFVVDNPNEQKWE